VKALSLGLILLFVLTAAVYFGFAERILDRMRLTDTQAVLFLALMILGSFVSVSIPAGQAELSINFGGAVVPLIIAIYLLAKAGTNWERIRSILAAVGTAAAIWGISSITDFGPEGGQTGFIDSVWLYSLIGGVVAYVLGRSRRAAFVAGTLGIILADMVYLTQVLLRGLPSTVALGGAGVLDATVLSGVIAVGLAELIGESRERIQGGPELGEDRPLALRVDEGVSDEERSNQAGIDDRGDRS
jgi:uncharacterized membrane protein